MPRFRRFHTVWFTALSLALQAGLSVHASGLPNTGAPVVPVAVLTNSRGQFTLVRGGKPYFIRGADGGGFLSELSASGGNSIRTWGDESSDPKIFAEAQRLDLTVLAGLWLPHTDEGFDYGNPKQVQRLVLHLKRYVERYRHSPAILMWGVGNEMEGDGKNPDVWRAIELVASMVHEIDPQHPTLTALAEVTPTKIAALKKYAPSIDVLGINSYASIYSLAGRLKASGWDKSYVITEFGPPGPWGQVPTTSWNAPIEPTSTEKAIFYYNAYQRAVASHLNHCLGSYVYYWGIEPTIVTTHTWYEMFLPEGHAPLGAVAAMTQAWAGRRASSRAPRIYALDSTADQTLVPQGSLQSARVVVEDPRHGHLRFSWEVRAESNTMTGPPPPIIPDSIKHSSGHEVVFKAPAARGAYRLFVYVYSTSGYAATANFPFFVKPASTASVSNHR